MAVLSRTITLASTVVTTPTEATVNVNLGDTIQLTITAAPTNTATWTTNTPTNCSNTPTTGARGAITTISFSAVGNYSLRISYTYNVLGFNVTLYGRIQGTITSGVDLDPDPFPFQNKPNVALNSVVESEPVTITGINEAANISSTNGSYYTRPNTTSAWTGPLTSGTITVNTQVKVSVNSASTFSTGATVNLKINNTTYGFTATTVAEDKTPDNFSNFNSLTGIAMGQWAESNTQTITGINTGVDVSISLDPQFSTGAEYRIDGGTYTTGTTTGTFKNGSTVQVKLQAASTPETLSRVYVTIGTVTKSFDVTSELFDRTPGEPFGFAPKLDAVRSQEYSSSFTVSGVNTSVDVKRKSGSGSFSTNQSTWYTTQTIGVPNDTTIYVRQTASPLFSTTTNTTLTIGTRDASFDVTTEAQDLSPENPFSYASISNATRSTWYPAEQPIKITGINDSITIKVKSGSGEFSVGNAQSWRTTELSGVGLNALVYVRQFSSAAFATAAESTFTMGTRDVTFTVTTESKDTTPENFDFGSRTAELNSLVTSDAITIRGINSPASLVYAGFGGYRKRTPPAAWPNDFVTGDTNVTLGDEIQVRIQAASTFSTLREGTVQVGGVQGKFSITTVAEDTTPGNFSFTPVTSATINLIYESNEITVTEINSTASVSFSGAGEYRRFTNGAWKAYGTGTESAILGDRFQIKISAAGTSGTTRSGTLNIGGVERTFTVTTAGGSTDTTPDQFSFNSLADLELNTLYPSNQITVQGINADSNISIVDGEYELNLNNNSWTTTASTVSNGTIVRVRRRSSTTNSSTVQTTLTIGGVQAAFTLTTKAGISTADYGFEVFNTSGVKTVDQTSRVPRLVAAGSTVASVPAGDPGVYNAATISVPGMVNNDTWEVLLYEGNNAFFSQTDTALAVVIGSGSFTIQASTTTASVSVREFPVSYYVIRS